MKVAAICPLRFASPEYVTGDATQMRETVQAIRNISGIEIEPLFFESAEDLKTSEGKTIKWAELADLYDVAHLFTMLPRGYSSVGKHLSKLPTLVSTVYWNSLFREYISVKNGTTPRFILRSFEYIFRRITGIRKQQLADWCIGILPNSWAEGNVFRKVYKLRKHAICVPVPNAATPPDCIRDLPRPADLPEGDYIVCPGIFAPRKNQIALIKAMKGSGIPIVFLGQLYQPVPSHYQKCIKAADKDMYFLGHVPSSTERYWAILSHAKAAVLPSDCETPGIALIEAAIAGARPVVTIHGGTQEYYGLMAEYLNPFSQKHIRQAVTTAWNRGRLTLEESNHFRTFSWDWTARLTVQAYHQAIDIFKHHYSK